MRAIMQATGKDTSKRFVYLSAFGVGTDLPKHSIIFRLVLRLSSLGASYEEHNCSEGIVRASETAWTIVRPPGLNDTDEVVPLVDAHGDWDSFINTSRRSVAAYLAETVDSTDIIHKTITIREERKRINLAA